MDLRPGPARRDRARRQARTPACPKGQALRPAAAGRRAGRSPPRKKLLIRKDGHVYSFLYAPEYERAALKAFAACPAVDAAEALAIVCYMGHDPRTLGLDLGARP